MPEALSRPELCLCTRWSARDSSDAVWKKVPKYMWCVSRNDLGVLKRLVRNAISDGTLKPPPRGSEFYNEEFDGVEIEKWDPTVYMVMEKLIKPSLTPTSSWTLDLDPKGKECHVFATHAWAEGIFEFIASARKSFPWPCKHMYVCFLGNPQDEASLKEIMSGNIFDSPFYQALSKAKWFIVIPTKRLCIYERLWCVFEMYHAQQRVRQDGDLKIRMSYLTNRSKVVATAAVPFCTLAVPGFFLAYFVLAPVMGKFAGPVSWLISLHMVGSATRFFIHWSSGWHTRHVHKKQVPAIEICLLKWMTYARLFLFGIGSGVSAWDFFNEHAESKDTTMTQLVARVHGQKKQHGLYIGFRWEHGEFVACCIFFISYSLMYVYNLLVFSMCQIIHDEGGKLNHFETVADAHCFSEADKRMILADIGNDIADIDEAIGDLRTIGKYDDEVVFNLRRGMYQSTIRNGINPFLIMCAMSTWEFWLITDLRGSGHWRGLHIYAASCIAGFLVVYGPSSYKFRALVPNEKFIFAVNSLAWIGIIFLLVSNHPTWFTRDAVQSFTMSKSTEPLQLALFGLWAFLNLLYYSGFLGYCRRKMKGRRSVHEEDPIAKGGYRGFVRLHASETRKV